MVGGALLRDGVEIKFQQLQSRMPADCLSRCDCATARSSKRMQQLAIEVAELNSYINASGTPR
jgi:hypothetical protein